MVLPGREDCLTPVLLDPQGEAEADEVPDVEADVLFFFALNLRLSLIGPPLEDQATGLMPEQLTRAVLAHAFRNEPEPDDRIEVALRHLRWPMYFRFRETASDLVDKAMSTLDMIIKEERARGAGKGYESSAGPCLPLVDRPS